MYVTNPEHRRLFPDLPKKPGLTVHPVSGRKTKSRFVGNINVQMRAIENAMNTRKFRWNVPFGVKATYFLCNNNRRLSTIPAEVLKDAYTIYPETSDCLLLLGCRGWFRRSGTPSTRETGTSDDCGRRRGSEPTSPKD